MLNNIGFIGLGNIGSMMALRLINEGFNVQLFDLDKEKINSLVLKGGTETSSITSLVSSSEVVLTSLPNSSIVKDVYLGEKGLIANAKENTCFIELSTIDPVTMTSIAKAAEKNSLKIIDAPVSGGPPEAREGKLTLLVGTNETVFTEYYSILESLAKDIFLVGDVGTGKIVKLVNNTITLGNVMVAAEAFQLGVGAGLEPNTLYNVLTKCAGRSFQFEKRFPKLIEEDFAPGFSIDLATKDLNLALDMANQFDKTVPLTNHIFQFYQTARMMGLGEQDIIAMGKVSEQIMSKKGEG